VGARLEHRALRRGRHCGWGTAARAGPEGVRERIRRAGYSRKELTYELIADTYALLMAQRRGDLKERPSWLNDEIYRLVLRMTGRSE
jgi:hypothetical protein